MPKLLGLTVEEPHDGFWRRSVDFARELGDVQAETAVLGVRSLVALILFKRFSPTAPGPLVVLGVSILAVAVLKLEDNGVTVVGEPEGALFDFGLPLGIYLGQLVDLLPGALAIVVLGFTESMGAAKAAAQKTGERLDPDQELLAIGAANLGAGISGGYVVTWALSKTSVAIASGGRTQVANLFAGVLGVLSILVLRPVFADLSQTALAAIVIFAMSGMANVTYFRTLWLMSRTEFLVALVAFLGVLSFGVLPGVVIGVVLSLVILIVHIGDPPTSVLGRTLVGDLARPRAQRRCPGPSPGSSSGARRHPSCSSTPVRTLADDPAVELLIADASGTTAIDTAGLTAFLTLRDELHARGVELWLVHPLLRIEEKSADDLALLGAEMPPVFDSLDEAVATFERRTDQR